MGRAMASSRNKRQPAAAPTPRIVNLPRRPHLRPSASSSKLPRPPVPSLNLAALLGQELRAREEAATTTGVAANISSSGEILGESSSVGEERWRFQAEILRAECNFLRMERELSLKKFDKNRAQMEAALCSYMDTLISGREKIDGSESVAAALDAEIDMLDEKIAELNLTGDQRRSRTKSKFNDFKELHRRRFQRNFDRQASVLRRKLERMEDASVKDIREIAVSEEHHVKEAKKEKNAGEDDEEVEEKESVGLESNRSCRFTDVNSLNLMEMLRRKMEGLSKGMLERMEECSHFMLYTNDKSSDGKRSGCSQGGIRPCTEAAPDRAHKQHCSQLQQQQQPLRKQIGENLSFQSCCNCKQVVGRIMQQVRAETEQWGEMQRMLEQVRMEMEELRSSRDIWQHQAVASEINFQSLRTQMLEWKKRARSLEQKVVEQQKFVNKLQNELQHLRADNSSTPVSTSVHPEFWTAEQKRIKSRQQRALDSQKEKEKHVLVCHLKPQKNTRRSPLQDINNTCSSSQDIEFAIQMY